jgi:GNAT superfamily N-acetyltransferase
MVMITDYKSEDKLDILEFFSDVFKDMGFTFNLTGKDKDLLLIPETYQTDGGVFLITRYDDVLCGIIALKRLSLKIMELKRFYVRKEYQGKGLGKQLLGELIKHARNTGAALRLDTTNRSQTAIALFRKYGFIEIPRYNDDPYAEIFMELHIGERSE